MLVNLDKVVTASFRGLELDLEFNDGSIHKRRFHSDTELFEVLEDWADRTRKLTGKPPVISPSKAN